MKVAENPPIAIPFFYFTTTSFLPTNALIFSFALVPKACPISGASILSSRILLKIFGIENGDRVAVGNAHDLPTNLLGMKRGGDEQEQ